MDTYLLTIDIGGTKTAYAIAKIADQVLNSSPIHKDISLLNIRKCPTPKGKESLLSLLTNITQQAQIEAAQTTISLLPIVAVGAPGRFIGEDQNIIAPGSAKNLESHSGEFDYLDLYDFIHPCLPKGIKLVVNNDAESQCIGGIYSLLKKTKTKPELRNQKIAYVGPGTGLGGGFAVIDDNWIPTLYSDGHIYDLLIPDCDGKKQPAEKLVSGKSLQKAINHQLDIVASSPKLIQRHIKEIQNTANGLAEIMIAIHLGQFAKQNPKNNWPQQDIEKAKGTRLFLLGGSLGTKGSIANKIQQFVKQYLKDRNFEKITFFPIEESDTCGLLGAAILALN